MMKTLTLALMIVSLVCALSITCAAVTLPFSDDFEGPSHPLGSNDSQHWDIMAGPGPNGEPPVNKLNWQVVDNNDNNAFTCLDASPNGNDRGLVRLKGVVADHFFEEVDVYNVDNGEVYLAGGIIDLPQLPQATLFTMNPNAAGGVLYFFNFGWYGDPNAWVGTTMVNFQGAFPHITTDNPTNRVHLTLTANGLTWTGTMQAYDATDTLQASGSTTYTWLAGLPVGGIGFEQYTSGAMFDNYHAEVYVPEPSSILCLSMGLLGAIGMIRRRR